MSTPSENCVLPQKRGMRFATLNTSLNRKVRGALATELAHGKSSAAAAVANLIANVKPDVLLLQELDWDPKQRNLETFYRHYLLPKLAPGHTFDFRHHFESNTGLRTQLDLDGNGSLNGAGDAQGFGFHHGQYAFGLLSRFAIEATDIRTYQHLLWRDLPGHHLDAIETEKGPWYSVDARAVMRLSSKNHVQVPISTSEGVVWIIASHPTPPVFDGPEDRNGWRNFDEIALIRRIISGEAHQSDQGTLAALAPDSHFVVMGDLNADPKRGDSRPQAITQVLNHPRINPETAVGKWVPKSSDLDTESKFDTATFKLRVDYVLPSRDMQIHASGICRVPTVDGKHVTDHHLVWVDASLPRTK